MARKRYSDEDILKLLREIELHLASGTCQAALRIDRIAIGLRYASSVSKQRREKCRRL